jgi:hypothetical protein
VSFGASVKSTVNFILFFVFDSRDEFYLRFFGQSLTLHESPLVLTSSNPFLADSLKRKARSLYSFSSISSKGNEMSLTETTTTLTPPPSQGAADAPVAVPHSPSSPSFEIYSASQDVNNSSTGLSPPPVLKRTNAGLVLFSPSSFPSSFESSWPLSPEQEEEEEEEAEDDDV